MFQPGRAKREEYYEDEFRFTGRRDVTAASAAQAQEQVVDTSNVNQELIQTDETYSIATVVKVDGIAWFDRMRDGVQQFGADTGHDTRMVGPSSADAAAQVQLVENLIAQGVDAIAIVPFSVEAVEPVFKKARDRGIVVISHEASNIQNVDYDIEAFDNLAYGAKLMDELAEQMPWLRWKGVTTRSARAWTWSSGLREPEGSRRRSAERALRRGLGRRDGRQHGLVRLLIAQSMAGAGSLSRARVDRSTKFMRPLMASPPLIELRGISKRFGGVRALDDVSMSIERAEIRCLAGENGSGKSTLIKIVSGVYQPDVGEILIDGVPTGRLDPATSIAHGVQVIYQDLSLFPTLSVVENLFLNSYLREKSRIVDWRRGRRMAREVLGRLDVALDLDANVETLPVAGRQVVAIARAVLADARLIIMDEPTTALTGREVERMFRIVRDLQAHGMLCSSSATRCARCSR